MSKDKLMIEIDEEVYTDIKEGIIRKHIDKVFCSLANGSPVSTDGDLISREALRKEVTEKVHFTTVDGHIAYDKMLNLIDNAPTIKLSLLPADESKEEAYKRGYKNGKAEALLRGRPKGEWIPCTKSGMPLTEQGRLSGEKWYGFKCSNPKCNYIYKGNALTESPFCQKCGADMRNTAKPTKEIIDKLGECKCNTCKHNGTWVCVNKCSCFDKYEGGTE